MNKQVLTDEQIAEQWQIAIGFGVDDGLQAVNASDLRQGSRAIESAVLAAQGEAFEGDALKLATAIAEAAFKAGIYNGQAPLNGPMLLMLADDLADAANKAREGATEMNKQVLTDEQIDQQRALFEAAGLQASLDELRALARAFDRMGLRGSAMALRDRAVNLEARLFVISGQIAEASHTTRAHYLTPDLDVVILKESNEANVVGASEPHS